MAEYHPTELLPAFVLGALSTHEAATVRLHLSNCTPCQIEAEACRAYLMAPPNPQLMPRTRVKLSLFQHVTSTRQHAVRPIQAQLILPLGMLLVCLLLGIASLYLVRPTGIANPPTLISQTSTAINQAELTILRNAQQTATHSLPALATIPAVNGTVYTRIGDRRIGVVLHDLPAAPSGHVYRIWLVEQHTLIPGSILTHNSDGSITLVYIAPQTIEHYSELMITLDPIDQQDGSEQQVLYQISL